MQSGKPIDNRTVQDLVTELSAAGQHGEVIELIESSLLAGQSQPWMYEVLALTMEIADRPRDQVERVLLSARDFSAADVESLLYMAAYLARFERYAQALKFCRQASDLEPNRPEPYIEALRIADRAKDDTSRAWAAVGVLTFAWGPGHEKARESALAAAADVTQSWKNAGKLKDVIALEAALSEAKRIDLRVRVEWSGAGDLDLEVAEPVGTVCSRTSRYTRGGGVFAHDGAGPQAANCYDEYLCPIASPGEYRIRVRHSWGTITGKRASLILIRGEGTMGQQREVIPVAVGLEDTIVRMTLKEGRRREMAAVEDLPLPKVMPERRTPTVLQQLAGQARGQVAPVATGATPAGNAVGYQPVIQFFQEGVSMSAMATVSGDRRYVRIRTTPIFSDITDVFTFSFVR